MNTVRVKHPLLPASSLVGEEENKPSPPRGRGLGEGALLKEEGEQRTAVLAEARSWLGTPYHHQADVKGAGVDCAMLLLRVYADCRLITAFDPRPYPIDWHLHRDEERYLGFVLDHAHAVDCPLPGDIAVFKYGRCFSHGGIVIDWPVIIHAFHPAGIVEEHDAAAGPLAGRERRFFSYWARE